jgi:hypothetical protein
MDKTEFILREKVIARASRIRRAIEMLEKLEIEGDPLARRDVREIIKFLKIGNLQEAGLPAYDDVPNAEQ